VKDAVDRACQILAEIEKHDLEEFEIEADGLYLCVSRSPAQGPSSSLAESTSSASAPSGPLLPAAGSPPPSAVPGKPPALEATEAGLVPIASPMIGMFYRAQSPDKPPFVSVGDLVEPGQPVCIIEAMKLMNIITATTRGKIARILAENQSAVQAGQVLMLVEPA
jgi:acetyl-CoA carboxylase biotin carboxyl carrier protein